MRHASTTMSWVAEAKAATKAQTIKMVSWLGLGVAMAMQNSATPINTCDNTNQLRRWPKRGFKKGSLTRSTMGDHKNFIE